VTVKETPPAPPLQTYHQASGRPYLSWSTGNLEHHR